MLESVGKIWDRGEYNSFTDLIRFRDRWVCTFREGVAHADDNGSVRVIASEDGRSWESTAFLTEEGIDLRDPKAFITPDGRLALLVGGTIYGHGDDGIRRSMVCLSEDGCRWTPWKQVVPDGHWLWRVTWHGSHGYGVSKLGDGDIPKHGFLWRTEDGLAYEQVHAFSVPAMSETTLRFTPGDGAVALSRRTGPGGGDAWVGSSAAPYTEWTWKETDYSVGGPNFLIMPDGRLWATSRLLTEGPTTALFRMTLDGIEPVLVLPSGGDTSYAGMVWHDGRLWLSYYSSHEEKPSIYLAKIRLPEQE